jgi:Flp pilus assembly protein TadD
VQRRQNEKAVPHLQRALRLQPDSTEARSLVGTAYVRLGQFTERSRQLEKAAPFDHNGNVHYQLYLAYRKLGQSELARKALTRCKCLRRSSVEYDQALIMGSHGRIVMSRDSRQGANFVVIFCYLLLPGR